MTDEDIARQVSENPDAAPILSDEELDRAEFGRRVRELRQKLGLSQPAFAERFQIPIASLRTWPPHAGCCHPRVSDCN
jgi:putative transcriptional regulator